MIKLKDILNEASEGELIDIYKPFKFWDKIEKRLKNGLKRHKIEAKGSFGGKVWSKVEMPFTVRHNYLRSRTVQPRRMFGGSDDNELLSIVRIFIKVLTDEQYQKVKEGGKINLDGIMTLEMKVEYNHSDGRFIITGSQLKWFHPFKKSIFKMSLGGGSTDDLLDYIEREIKFAVKKRGNRIKGAAFRVV